MPRQEISSIQSTIDRMYDVFKLLHQDIYVCNRDFTELDDNAYFNISHSFFNDLNIILKMHNKEMLQEIEIDVFDMAKDTLFESLKGQYENFDKALYENRLNKIIRFILDNRMMYQLASMWYLSVSSEFIKKEGKGEAQRLKDLVLLMYQVIIEIVEMDQAANSYYFATMAIISNLDNITSCDNHAWVRHPSEFGDGLDQATRSLSLDNFYKKYCVIATDYNSQAMIAIRAYQASIKSTYKRRKKEGKIISYQSKAVIRSKYNVERYYPANDKDILRRSNHKGRRRTLDAGAVVIFIGGTAGLTYLTMITLGVAPVVIGVAIALKWALSGTMVGAAFSRFSYRIRNLIKSAIITTNSYTSKISHNMTTYFKSRFNNCKSYFSFKNKKNKRIYHAAIISAYRANQSATVSKPIEPVLITPLKDDVQKAAERPQPSDTLSTHVMADEGYHFVSQETHKKAGKQLQIKEIYNENDEDESLVFSQ